MKQLFLYDKFQSDCIKLIEKIKTAKDQKSYTQACYDLADEKVQYYLQFEHKYPECSNLSKFYQSQLGFALRERAEIVDKLHDLGVEIA